MIKRILVFVLAAVMLLQCGCAVASTEAEMADAVISSDITENLNTAGSSDMTVVASQYSYVRGGEHSEKNFRTLNETVGTKDVIVAKNNGAYSETRDGDVNTREFYLTFDLSPYASQASSLKSATLGMSVKQMAEPGLPFEVYFVKNNPELQSLTWDTRPYGTLLDDKYVISSLTPTDILDWVDKAFIENGGILTLRFKAVNKTSAETHINCKEGSLPYITLSALDISGGYTKNLVDDAAENKAIWDYSQKLFDEWYARYEAIVADMANDPEVEKIERNDSEFTKFVASYGSNSKTTKATHNPTRTVEALEGLNISAEVEVDEFGGIIDDSIRQDATGFFYTKKIGDRWWVINPYGRPTYIRALSGVTIQYSPNSRQKPAAIEKYGTEDKWAIAITRRLKDDLGFYLSTSTSSSLQSVEDRLFRQVGIGGFAANYGSQQGVNASVGGSTVFSENNTMPVFDPGFEEYSDKRASEILPKYAGDGSILGFTTDNELPMQVAMLTDYLTIDPKKPANIYSYAAAWTWLVNMTGEEQPSADDITDELCELFRGFVWDRYFNVVCGAVRKYDNEHMLLGTRFLTRVNEAEWVLRFASLYLDAITINWYGSWEPEPETLWNICTYGDLPFMVTEFYAKAKENEGNLEHTDTSAGWLVQTQSDRGYFYQNFTLRLLECKNVIGWHWFQFLDCDPTGTQTDKSSLNSNKGIFSNTHNEYHDLTDKMIEINKNVYELIEYFDEK